MVAMACTLPQGEAWFTLNYHKADSSNIMSHPALRFMVHCQMIYQQTQPPTQSEKYQCRIDTVSSPDDGHIVAWNM